MNGESQQHGSGLPLLRKRRAKTWLHVILFLLTLITTTIAGAFQNGVNPLSDPWTVTSGLPFSVTLMIILLVHEMGHYLMSRYHGVRASLPFFLPAPPFPFIIGTFGAFIRMDSPPPDRRSLFDVGAAGPLAGLLLAIPAVIIGLRLSTVSHDEGGGDGIALGSSLLLSFLSQVTLGLMRWWDGWLIWGLLLLLLGVRHPPPLDPYTPLDFKRQLIAWLTLAILALTFIPVPFSLQEPKVQKESLMPKPTALPVEARVNGVPR